MSSALSEHEYEPIGTPALVMARSNASTPGTTAPVVRINDTDVVHVADSDESIDAQERRLYTSNKLVLDGDVVVPLDGEIEDNAMQARELGDNGDTSEDQETPQQLQDRLEERFLNAATPCTESRTDAEINTSQVDSSALEELPLRRGARGFPQRLRSQAGKLRSRLRGIQRPSFSLPERQKTDNKTKTTKVEKPKVAKPKSEKSRFSLPDRPKFSMPERPKFNFPDRAKFSMPERPKFNIKRPNINLPTLGRVRKPLKERQNSSESNSSAKRNIFDFSTYPRLFDKKSKNRGEYATSSPKASRGQSPEVATVPRVKKKAPIGARWVQKFSDLKFADDEPESAVERSKPWRHPSIEEPQVAFRREATESRERLPWEESDDRSIEPPAPPLPLPDEIADEESREERANRDREEDEDVDYEEESADIENRRIIVALPLGHGLLPSPEEELAAHVVEEVPDPRLYPRGLRGDSLDEEMRRRGAKEKWQHESDEEMTGERAEKEVVGERDPYGHDEYSGEMIPGDSYGRGFMPIDPPMKYVLEREQTPEDSSMRSDREQQSSGSSCDRRRRGVLEEIDSDEFFLRAKGISQDDMNLGRFLASEIRDAFRPTPNALADQELDLRPPTRPVRTRSLRKKRWDETPPPESHNATPPARPKRDRRRSEDSVRVEEYESYLPEKAGSVSGSRHRVMYQTEAVPRAAEPLDDIVVVKPARRKSRSVARSCSDLGSDALPPLPTPPTPPVAPRRRKRGRRNFGANGNGPYLNGHGPTTTICNGHRRDVEWSEGIDYPPEVSNEPENLNREQLQTLVNRLDHEYIEPAPIAPKRRSRSRGTSVADDDRTSRGAESLPEVSYLDEEDAAGQETDSRDLPGYAVVDKREKPPRPPPPRRRREKFATSPRTPPTTAIPTVPVRPTRAYSTLGPAARRRSPSEDRSVNQMDVTPYTELDSDDPDCNELQSGQVLNKIQGRPLPAPPRPPRSRRDAPDQASTISNGLGEVAASTQTDPLPDDVVIEEEVTRARLVMTPSRAGSQILVSTERVATPTFGRNSPAVPPLPQSVHSERFVEPSQEAETGTPDPRGSEGRPDRPVTPARPASSLLLQHDDRIRIASLEVGDLKVERLNVSQLEAHKISASEVDAIVISASEMSNNSNTSNAEDGGIHPSLLRELIAIRSHLEQAALARQGREPTPESSRVQTIDEKVKDQPLSAVDELIEALKKSDRSDEGTEIMEESERIDEQVETNDEKTLFEALKPIEEDQSISKTETVQEVSQRDERKTEVTEDTKVFNKSPASVDIMAVKPDKTPEKVPEVESTSDSVSTVKTASVESALSPPIIENLELAKASAPPNISEPNTVSSLNTDQEEIRIQGQSSLRDESKCEKRKCPRSRSSSPTIDGKKAVRQTASPVKSLPPLISVTPDTPDPVPSPVPEVQAQPQRATVSYTQSIDEEVSLRQQVAGVTQFVAFPTSQIPANFFSLASPIDSRYESEPSIMDMTQQLLRALRLAGTRAMRHFVGYVASRVSTEDRGEKIKEIELAICALLLLIAGLLILCFGSPRTVTHHHHWDYFNPPQ